MAVRFQRITINDLGSRLDITYQTSRMAGEIIAGMVDPGETQNNHRGNTEKTGRNIETFEISHVYPSRRKLELIYLYYAQWRAS